MGQMGQRCAMAEHHMPVRTSFHRLSRGGNTLASWCSMVQRECSMVQRCDSETSLRAFARTRTQCDVRVVVRVMLLASSLARPGGAAREAPMGTHNRARAVNREMWPWMRVGAFPVLAFGLVTLRMRSAGRPLHGPQKQMGEYRHVLGICAQRPISLTRDAHVTDDTARPLRYSHAQNAKPTFSLSHRCTMEHPVAPWSTTMRRVLPPPRQTVKLVRPA